MIPQSTLGSTRSDMMLHPIHSILDEFLLPNLKIVIATDSQGIPGSLQIPGAPAVAGIVHLDALYRCGTQDLGYLAEAMASIYATSDQDMRKVLDSKEGLMVKICTDSHNRGSSVRECTSNVVAQLQHMHGYRPNGLTITWLKEVSAASIAAGVLDMALWIVVREEPRGVDQLPKPMMRLYLMLADMDHIMECVRWVCSYLGSTNEAYAHACQLFSTT